MKLRMMLSVLALATAFGTVGCDEKKDGDDKTAKSADKKGDKKADKGGGDLPKECEEYIKAQEACFANMPAAAKGPLEESFKQTREGFKASMKTPEGKKALGTSCKQLADSVKNNPACKK